MHAFLGARTGSEPCNKIRGNAMDEFTQSNDLPVLLQDREMSSLGGFPKKQKTGLKDDIWNNFCYNEGRTCGQGDLFAHPMNLEGSTRCADENDGISNDADEHHASQFPYVETSSLTMDEQNDKGKELLDCDWPELGDFEDFETMFSSAFEQGSNNYAEELSWSSISSPDIGAHLVPSSSLFAESNPTSIVSEKPVSPVLRPSMPLSQTAFQEELPFEQKGRDRLLQYPGFDLSNTETFSCSEGLEAMLSSNAHLLMSTSSAIMLDDEYRNASSSKCIEPDLITTRIPQCQKKLPSSFGKTPDMILEEMAQKPFQEQFLPALSSTTHQPELLMNATSIHKQKHNALHCSGTPFHSVGMAFPALLGNPCSSLILEAVPVKVLGFQKLQQSMNQLDVRAKMCIRDSLYRLANCVEQRHRFAYTVNGNTHCVDGNGQSVDTRRFASSKLTEIPTNPMDRSVVRLLFDKT